MHLNSTAVTDAQLATEAKRRAYIVLNAWEGALISKLKAANPSVQVFVYKDLSSTRSYACHNGVDDAQLPTGIGYCDASRNHPEWFLLSPAGQRLQYSGYSGHWQMDIGNVAYQNAWADAVISASKASGFDGVLMDNALFSCATYHDNVCPARYPTDASIQTAYKAMFANTRAKFTSAGLKTVANLANARLYAGGWNAYTTNLDGGFDEWWLTFSDTNRLPEYSEGWSRQLAEISANEARGKITWVQPHFSDSAQAPFRYALASFLMVSGPRSAFSPVARTDGYGDPPQWRSEYTWRLGAPSGSYRAIATNLFRRDFACGMVLVNANPAGAATSTVPLGGTYTDEAGRTVTSVRLAGTSGSILRRSC
ncbi:putative glycoside hydrolase [Lentzea aerocolonigenes]|uniref:putative glycoside hydrolase n=1 Tax=Lentzea aerocolonigenes TaxID=68170 RepID=UPI0018C8BBF4|nr:putative glycoside hydrolase [Lentzea aerocolonigenes]